MIWSPSTNKYDQKIKKNQQKMLKFLSNECLKNLSYEQKLSKTKLLSLRARRVQHQLMMMFKMKNREIDLCFHEFFVENSCRITRGNLYKLLVPKTTTKKRKDFFTSSCERHWNLLKSSEVSVRSSSLFKRSINYLRREKIC